MIFFLLFFLKWDCYFWSSICVSIYIEYQVLLVSICRLENNFLGFTKSFTAIYWIHFNFGPQPCASFKMCMCMCIWHLCCSATCGCWSLCVLLVSAWSKDVHMRLIVNFQLYMGDNFSAGVFSSLRGQNVDAMQLSAPWVLVSGGSEKTESTLSYRLCWPRTRNKDSPKWNKTSQTNRKEHEKEWWVDSQFKMSGILQLLFHVQYFRQTLGF